MARARRRALQAGRRFRLSWRDVYPYLRAGHCWLTHIPFEYDREERPEGSPASPFVPSIDRIDSSKGYTPGNVRVVCWAINQARGAWPDYVFDTVARAYVEWN